MLSVQDFVEVLSETVAEIIGVCGRGVCRVVADVLLKNGGDMRASGRRETYLIWRLATGRWDDVLRIDVAIVSCC